MKNKLLKVLLSVITVVVLWYVIFIIVGTPFIFPHLHEVIIEAIKKITNLTDLSILKTTLIHLVILVLITMILAILIGYLAFVSKEVEVILTPIISIFKTTPLIVILVIMIIVLGTKLSAFVIVLFVSFPIAYLGIKDHFENIQSRFDHLLRLEKTTHFRSLKCIFLPLSKNYFTTTLLQTMGLSLKVLVMSEYIIQMPHSIGREIYMNKIDMNYLSIYAWASILIVTSLLIDFYVKKLKSHV